MSGYAVGLAVATLLVPGLSQQRDAPAKDDVAIVSVQPDGPLTRGVEVELTFEVDVTLQSEDEAILHLGFNTDQPRSFEMLESYAIYRGTERVTLKAKVTPVDWGRRGKFAALMNIGPKERKNYVPETSVTHAFEVVP
jgi:hypothetical protein